jgi:ABC-2 type transport system permease protein
MDKNGTTSSSKRFGKGFLHLMAGLAIIFLVNFISSILYVNIDLTTDNRHTLNDKTIELLDELDDVIFVKVYLKGEFSREYKRLAQATKEKLSQLRSHSKGRIEFEFLDPSGSKDDTERVNFYKQLRKKGLEFTSERSGAGETGERIVWPGAIVSYRDQEIPVQLMKGEVFASLTENVGKAINNLEYNFSNAIQKFLLKKTQKVGLLAGHGELAGFEIIEFKQMLEEYYKVDEVEIAGKYDALIGFDALIIAQPDSMIPDIDRFVIDQFIMRGGKTLWLIDPMQASMDSLSSQVSTSMAMQRRLNIEDQLFKYGVNLNANLILDMNAAAIPIGDRMVAGKQQFTLYPWFYFPLVTPISTHPIALNLDPIKLQFVSSLDTTNNPRIKKTVLLHTSRYSRVVSSPVRVSINILKVKPKPELFNKPFQPVAVLLEGEFESVWRYNMPAGVAGIEGIDTAGVSVPNKMIVVSDGDIARNAVVPGENGETTTFPLGYDKYTQQIYSNGIFLLNCMNYLMDDDGLITARVKNQKVRILDERQIESRETFWKQVNIVLPILLIILFGITRYFKRIGDNIPAKRKSARIITALAKTAFGALTIAILSSTMSPDGRAYIALYVVLFVVAIAVGLFEDAVRARSDAYFEKRFEQLKENRKNKMTKK